MTMEKVWLREQMYEGPEAIDKGKVTLCGVDESRLTVEINDAILGCAAKNSHLLTSEVGRLDVFGL